MAYGGDTHDDVTLGEVDRSVKRLEAAVAALSGQMAVALGPIAEVRVRLENAREDINEIASAQRACTSRMEKIELRAAGVAGGVSALAFLAKFLLVGK